MMFIDRLDESEAVGDVADYYAAERASGGFVPNYAAAFAARPEVANAWRSLNAAVRAGMDRRRYEIASIGASRAVRCTYCTAAHSLFLRDICGDEAAVRAIAADPAGGALDEVDAAVLRFAGKVASAASSVDQDDVDHLRELGLSDADVVDVVYAAAARAFFTAVLDGLGARLDPQTAAAFEPDVLAGMVVGRPPADDPACT